MSFFVRQSHVAIVTISIATVAHLDASNELHRFHCAVNTSIATIQLAIGILRQSNHIFPNANIINETYDSMLSTQMTQFIPYKLYANIHFDNVDKRVSLNNLLKCICNDVTQNK